MLKNSMTYASKYATKSKVWENDEMAKAKADKGRMNEIEAEINVEVEIEEQCEECKREIEEDQRIFQFPSVLPSRAKTDAIKNFWDNPGERVTIATGDAMCLFVERFYYTLVLLDESKADMTSVFRKKVLETKTVPNGRVETVVLALDCCQDYFITTVHGALELNYHTSVPKPDEPDERVFDVFYTNLGYVLFQPKLHPNTYLHHLDNSLSIQQLDLNWRCPEEYFFHFNAVPETAPWKTAKEEKDCTHFQPLKKKVSSPPNVTSGTKESQSEKHQERLKKTFTERLGEYGSDISSSVLKQTLERYAIESPSRKPKKTKKRLSSLFLGCFGARSHAIVT